MDMNEFEKWCKRLKDVGRLDEILGADGKIEPSDKAKQQVATEHLHKSDAHKHRLAQAETVMDSVKKYLMELN